MVCISSDVPMMLNRPRLSSSSRSGATVTAWLARSRVRVAVSNAERKLRPGMFVEASLRGRQSEAQPLVIPSAAPLFTGRRSLVYVAVPSDDRPTYEARVVRLGPRVGDWYPVVAGLQEGDMVVTHGAFALDADLQIRGGQSMMMSGDDSSERPYDDAIVVPPEWVSGLAPVVEAYLEMQRALANDYAASAKSASSGLNAAVAEFEPDSPTHAVQVWQELAQHLLMHSQMAADSESIESLRAQF